MPLELALTLRRAEGALIRVLGLIERRGFRLHAVHAAPDANTDVWNLRLTADGTRNPHTLQQQLGKLYDCLAVEITTPPAGEGSG